MGRSWLASGREGPLAEVHAVGTLMPRAVRGRGARRDPAGERDAACRGVYRYISDAGRAVRTSGERRLARQEPCAADEGPETRVAVGGPDIVRSGSYHGTHGGLAVFPASGRRGAVRRDQRS